MGGEGEVGGREGGREKTYGGGPGLGEGGTLRGKGFRGHSHHWLYCVTQRQMRELLIRLVYCEMLGVECSWGYIHAIKMTQSGNIMDKRIGTHQDTLGIRTVGSGQYEQ